MSLVTIARYRSVTGDTATLDATVQTALTDAENTVEAYLGRPLAATDRVETVSIFSNGRGYPQVTPVTSITSPATTTNNGYAMTFSAVTDWDDPPYGATTVTYSGGWTASTIPFVIVQVICALANAQVIPTVSAVPAGATSFSAGELSVSYQSPRTPLSDTQEILSALRPWRYRATQP